MFLIDENSFRLLKMMESLLKTGNNTEEYLNRYQESARKIDELSFDSLIDMIKDIENHSHSLEEELVFLEEILKLYNQLDEMQHRFRSVYETYTDKKLELSDLMEIDIDALNERISAISGYLVNLRNIDENKKKSEELSQQLILEVRKEQTVSERITSYEDALVVNFLNAEGRTIGDGKIKYTSVVSEYKECGLDFRTLLENDQLLEDEFRKATDARKSNDEKLTTAEMCYDKIPNSDNRGILASIRMDAVKARYKLALVKILKLLSVHEISYEGAKNKRESLLDLIKYRVSCLEKMGVKFSIDPFGRTKINEQIDAINQLGDNSKTISNIRKRINILSDRTEEMVNQNVLFLSQLNDKKPLLHDNLSMSSIDISDVSVPEEEVVEVLPNQVIAVSSLLPNFLIDRVSEKTHGVIKRVHEMMNKEELYHEEAIAPTLIVQESLGKSSDDSETYQDDSVMEPQEIEESYFYDEDVIDEKPVKVIDESANNDLFAEVEPFMYEPSLFEGKMDDEFNVFPESNVSDVNVTDDADEQALIGEGEIIDFVENVNLGATEQNAEMEETSVVSDEDMEMPDAFWVTQEDTIKDVSGNVLSFDEQIEKLLAKDDGIETDVKTRKLVA